jgi:hypothetical protein
MDLRVPPPLPQFRRLSDPLLPTPSNTNSTAVGAINKTGGTYTTTDNFIVVATVFGVVCGVALLLFLGIIYIRRSKAASQRQTDAQFDALRPVTPSAIVSLSGTIRSNHSASGASGTKFYTDFNLLIRIIVHQMSSSMKL